MTALTVTALDVRPLPGAIVRQFTAGEPLTLGDVVYMKGADSKVWHTDANASGTVYALGIVISVSTFGGTVSVAGDRVGVLLYGPVAGFTVVTGARVWVSDTEAKLDDAAGSIEVVAGIGLPDSILLFNPHWIPVGAAGVAPGTISATELASNAVTTVKILAANVTEPKIEAGASGAGLTGLVVRPVGDKNAIGGIPVIHRILLAATGAAFDTDVTLTHLTRVLDAWVVMKGVGPTGATITVKNVGNAITDAMVTAAAVDHAVVRAGLIIDSYQEVAAGTVLRVSTAATSGTIPAAEVYILGVRVL